MQLVKVNIIDNHKITGNLNALQYINRDATAMFIGYNEKCNGAIYMMQKHILDTVANELNIIDIDFKVIESYNCE